MATFIQFTNKFVKLQNFVFKLSGRHSEAFLYLLDFTLELPFPVDFWDKQNGKN